MDTNQEWRGLAVSRIVVACQKCHETLDIWPVDLKTVEHRCPNKTNHWEAYWGVKGETWRQVSSTPIASLEHR